MQVAHQQCRSLLLYSWCWWLLSSSVQPWDLLAGVYPILGGAVRDAPHACPPLPGWTCGFCCCLLLWTTAGAFPAPGSWRNRVCFCTCWMCGDVGVQLTGQRSFPPLVQGWVDSATEFHPMLAHGGGRLCCLSYWVAVQVGVRVKQVVQQLVCFCENQTGSLTCLFTTLLVINEFAQQ